ncbi:MAG: AbrB/MazE/SpoVT family DNA-binding domain-containing protein [Anaerolineales bacterium]|nr:AbrB/MazE/SpoVT family DNA-binding domain-containing protein [Anaerolineales bacterium]
MNTVIISSKYQVVIPRKIREQFNLKPGHKVMFIPYNQTLRVVIVRPLKKHWEYWRGLMPIHSERKKSGNCRLQTCNG